VGIDCPRYEDRPTKAPAVIVIAQRRLLGRRVESSSLDGVVAEVLVSGAVEFLRAGFQRHRDGRAGVQSVLGALAGRYRLEFRNEIGRDVYVVVAAGASRVLIIHIVHHEGGRVGTATVYRECSAQAAVWTIEAAKAAGIRRG